MSKHTHIQDEYIEQCKILADILLKRSENEPDKAKIELEEVLLEWPYGTDGKERLYKGTSMCIDMIAQKRNK